MIPAPAPAADQPEVDRAQQIRDNLAAVRRRIDSACVEAGRSADSVTLVAITKTRPASDVRILAELGIRHIGENRDQEARLKAAECSDLDLVWHFVGQLQRNKAGSVARYADIVESVDRAVLVDALDRAAQRAGRQVGTCIQVDLEDGHGDATGPGGRGGARPDEIDGLAERIASTSHLDLRGLMAVAPLGVDPREPFERLAALREQLARHHPEATMLSAGMSADLEAAIAAGATHVRLGSALLGHRSTLK